MRHQRTRSGCLTCRSRRKKCDEVKPRCAGCRRNQLVCNWPVALTLSRSGSETSTGVSVSSLVPVASSVPPPMSTVHRGADSELRTRPCMLTAQSTNLLSHFIVNTAACFAVGPVHQNPWVSVIVPLASTDDLLMHAVLALSGAHLTSSDPTLPMGAEMTRATNIHYAKLIAGIRSELSGLTDDDLEKKESLLRLLMLACHYEAVSGNIYGAIFDHLAASRHLVTSLVANLDRANRIGHSSLSLGTLGFSIEMYTYMMLTNAMVMPRPYRHTLSHVLVMSFDEMAHFSTFGCFFAGAHGLYQLVPEIGQLASDRLLEEAAELAQPSQSLKTIHDSLHDRLVSWEMPPTSHLGDRDWDVRSCSAEAWRHALHIYLFTALAGSTVPDHLKSSVLALHTIEAFTRIGKVIASQQNYFATLLWPALISGSCITQLEGQQNMLRVFRTTWSGMRHMLLWADVLQLMWEDPDPRAYGPYGLLLTMEKYNRVIGIL